MRSDLNKQALVFTYVVVAAPFLAAWGYNRAHFMWMVHYFATLTGPGQHPRIINTDF